MCESGYYLDVRAVEGQVLTLYGVVHEAMLAGKTYAEIVSATQAWVKEHGLCYIRTSIELKDGQLYLVVRTCADFDEIGKQEYVVVNDIQVPVSFQARAQERLRQQLQ